MTNDRMDDDVVVAVDEIEAYDDGTVARIRVLRVPESSRFPDGLKYAFHYGTAGETQSGDTVRQPPRATRTPSRTSVVRDRIPWTHDALPDLAGGASRRETA